MDSGNIKCVVSNKNGTDECSAKLTAVCKLRTNYSIVKSGHTVNQGRIVTWDLPGNIIAARSAKNFFVPGSAFSFSFSLLVHSVS